MAEMSAGWDFVQNGVTHPVTQCFALHVAHIYIYITSVKLTLIFVDSFLVLLTTLRHLQKLHKDCE